MKARSADPQHVSQECRSLHAPGLLLRSPRLYDLIAQIFFLGRERAFRERLLSFAGLRPGERVLDVGCGTGSLAILAKLQVGPAGAVAGIDASAEMIAHARHKTDRKGLAVDFRVAPAQALPFPAAQFDVVLSTLMLHHLPKPAHTQLASEARRVLRPGGRLLVVDFENSAAAKPSWRALHQRHGSIDPDEVVASLVSAGLEVVARGPVSFKHLTFVLARTPDELERDSSG